LRSNTKCYGGKTHYTDSQNSDTAVHRGRELYHLQFSLQAVSPETFGHTLVCVSQPGLRETLGLLENQWWLCSLPCIQSITCTE